MWAHPPPLILKIEQNPPPGRKSSLTRATAHTFTNVAQKRQVKHVFGRFCRLSFEIYFCKNTQSVQPLPSSHPKWNQRKGDLISNFGFDLLNRLQEESLVDIPPRGFF